jgi:hypothetical protein
MQSLIHRTDRPLSGIKIRFKEHIRYIIPNNPQSAYVVHILHNTHAYGPMETTMILLHSSQKGKRMNTLENYCIHKAYFHKHNMIIKEENQEEKIHYSN